MIPERIKELRALCDAVTPSGWDVVVSAEPIVRLAHAAHTALPEALAEIERLRGERAPDADNNERLMKLLDLIAEEKRPCKACQAPLWFVRHKNGKIAPYTADATNHFINCPRAKEFRR